MRRNRKNNSNTHRLLSIIIFYGVFVSNHINHSLRYTKRNNWIDRLNYKSFETWLLIFVSGKIIIIINEIIPLDRTFWSFYIIFFLCISFKRVSFQFIGNQKICFAFRVIFDLSSTMIFIKKWAKPKVCVS